MRELYTSSLKEICNFQFTLREIDVISCVLHNRGEKKIASILDISPSTVNTHLYNVMNKIGYHSRESIVDLIERSKKLTYLKKHYFYLLANKMLKQAVKKIGDTVNFKMVTCNIQHHGLSERSKEALLILTRYLKLANIIFVENNPNLEGIGCNICINGNLRTAENNTPDTINLAFENADISECKSANYVNFGIKEDFHNSLFKLLKQILGFNTDISAIYEGFKSEYKDLQISWENVGTINAEQNTSNIRTKFIKLFLRQSPVIVIVGFIILVGGVVSYTKSLPNSYFTKLFSDKGEERPQSYKKLDNMLSIINDYPISSDNITFGNLHKNHIIVRQFEQMSGDYGYEDLVSYFSMPENSEKLVTYLYIVQAAATYYNYQEYDQVKALNIIIKAINVTENYINNMNKIAVSFNDLLPEELIRELEIVKELPEIYTRILYTLGRSYMLQGNLAKATEYFTKAEYAGKKLGLFEGYLSKYEGLLEIERSKIIDTINNGDYQTAKTKMLELLTLYESYKKTVDKTYIINYEPYKKAKVVKLQDNMQHMIECGIKPLRTYGMLLSITNTPQEKSLYTNLILKQIIGDKSYPGILYFIDKVDKRRRTDTINIIGNTLLQMHYNQINLGSVKTALNYYFKFINTEDLDFIEQLFKCAKLDSKINDYTRIESIKGLLRVYEAKINSRKTTEKQRENLIKVINGLKEEKSYIENF